MGRVDEVHRAPRASGVGSPGADPRTKPELLKILREVGLDGLSPTPEVDENDFDAVLEFAAEADGQFETVYRELPNELPGDEDRPPVTSDFAVAGDGHRIELRIFRPRDVAGEIPCVVYLHGGGMTILSAFNKVHLRWCEDLAKRGMVVVAVDFRTAYSPDGPRPFPTGLEDCSAAVQWVDARRAELGISKVVVMGESGGANLALATALKADQDGAAGLIDGVYATVPYISGMYAWDAERLARELPSLVDLDGYLITRGLNALLTKVYDPTGENSENPLCWPYFATTEELRGLPPHVISVNELDPLRDEGTAYLRKLQEAGVSTVGRMNLGLIHAAELIFRQALSRDYFATVDDIHAFASRL